MRPCPHGAPRGYSRPMAAVTSCHQRVAVWPVIPLAGSETAAAPGHGHYRRQQVARHARSSRPLAPGGRGNVQRVTFNFQLPPWRRCCEDGTPDHRALRSGRVRAICNLQFAIRNGRAGDLASCIWEGGRGAKRSGPEGPLVGQMMESEATAMGSPSRRGCHTSA